jgi:hypothetical protein
VQCDHRRYLQLCAYTVTSLRFVWVCRQAADVSCAATCLSYTPLASSASHVAVIPALMPAVCQVTLIAVCDLTHSNQLSGPTSSCPHVFCDQSPPLSLGYPTLGAPSSLVVCGCCLATVVFKEVFQASTISTCVLSMHGNLCQHTALVGLCSGVLIWLTICTRWTANRQAGVDTFTELRVGVPAE